MGQDLIRKGFGGILADRTCENMPGKKKVSLVTESVSGWKNVVNWQILIGKTIQN